MADQRGRTSRCTDADTATYQNTQHLTHMNNAPGVRNDQFGRYYNRERLACRQYGYESGCIVPGCEGSTMLHHLVPRRLGGTDAISNLISICHRHEFGLHKAGHLARVQEEFPYIDIVALSKMHRVSRKQLLRKIRTQDK